MRTKRLGDVAHADARHVEQAQGQIEIRSNAHPVVETAMANQDLAPHVRRSAMDC